MARSAVAKASMARLRLPGVLSAPSPTARAICLCANQGFWSFPIRHITIMVGAPGTKYVYPCPSLCHVAVHEASTAAQRNAGAFSRGFAPFLDLDYV